MKLLSIFSSDMDKSMDPTKIILQGSNNYNRETGEGSFVNLYNSKESLDFSKRNTKYDFPLSNTDSYNHYALVLEKSETAEKIHIGNFGLVQSYTRQVIANFQEQLAGIVLAPGTIQVKSGQALGTIPNPSSEWIVSFKAQFTQESDFDSHKGILRFTTTNNHYNHYGDRLPAFYTVAGKHAVHFISGTTHLPNDKFDGGEEVIELNKDLKFKAIAIGSYCKLYIDDQLIGQLTQDKSIRPVLGPLKVEAYIIKHHTIKAAEGVYLSDLIYTPVF